MGLSDRRHNQCTLRSKPASAFENTPCCRCESKRLQPQIHTLSLSATCRSERCIESCTSNSNSVGTCTACFPCGMQMQPNAGRSQDLSDYDRAANKMQSRSSVTYCCHMSGGARRGFLAHRLPHTARRWRGSLAALPVTEVFFFRTVKISTIRNMKGVSDTMPAVPVNYTTGTTVVPPTIQLDCPPPPVFGLGPLHWHGRNGPVAELIVFYYDRECSECSKHRSRPMDHDNNHLPVSAVSRLYHCSAVQQCNRCCAKSVT